MEAIEGEFPSLVGGGGGGGCVAQRKHFFFPLSSPGFESWLSRYIFLFKV